MSSRAALLIQFLLGSIVHCQLGFPELPSQRLDSENTTNRVPLYVPSLCPENQLLYPGTQKHDWICDCGPGYIYYPDRDFCFHVYRKGPCEEGQHLIIPEREVVPKCKKNPCHDGFAIYGGSCYEMGKPGGPCRPAQQGGGIFDVNATTLVVECLKGTDKLSLFDPPHHQRACRPGSRRNTNGDCSSR